MCGQKHILDDSEISGSQCRGINTSQRCQNFISSSDDDVVKASFKATAAYPSKDR